MFPTPSGLPHSEPTDSSARPSCPPEHIRQLRDLTRSRTIFVAEKSREIQRIEKLLEDANVKISSVAIRTLGVSGRAMLEALVAGERDPATLADLARGRLKNKSRQLTLARNGRFNDHHAYAVKMHLDHIDSLDQRISDRIDSVMDPLAWCVDLLTTIPGISKAVAEVVVAETGADMAQFPTAAHLASWAGVCPGHNESAGKIKSSHARTGNAHLKGALGSASMAAVRTNGTLQSRYKRLTSRRGPMRALVAIEHSMIVTIWHMLTNATIFDDLGPDNFQQTHRRTTERRAISQLHQLGYDVQLTPVARAT